MSLQVKEAIKFTALQTASESYGERIPDNWNELSDTEQDIWLVDNRFESYGDLTPSGLFELIDCHADSIASAFKAMLSKIIESEEVNEIIEGQAADLVLDLQNLNEITKIDHPAVYKEFNRTLVLEYKDQVINPPSCFNGCDEVELRAVLGDSKAAISLTLDDLVELI
jgi:hypothetical protein